MKGGDNMLHKNIKWVDARFHPREINPDNMKPTKQRLDEMEPGTLALIQPVGGMITRAIIIKMKGKWCKGCLISSWQCEFGPSNKLKGVKDRDWVIFHRKNILAIFDRNTCGFYGGTLEAFKEELKHGYKKP